MKLTKEEKIKRLQEQIRAIENGEDKKRNIKYENKYFYVRAVRTWGSDKEEKLIRYTSYEPVMKKYSCIAKGTDRIDGYTMRFDDYNEWKKAVLELIGFMDAQNKEGEI